MQRRTLLSRGTISVIAIVAAQAVANAQSSTPAQVQPRETTAPASAYTPPPLPSVPAPAPTPTYNRTDTAIPALPSIEAAPLPRPTTAGSVRANPATPLPQARGGRIPAPIDRPLTIDAANDTVLALGRDAAPSTVFRDAIAAAVDRNPSLAEAEAQAEEAQGQRREARAGLFPTADINVTYYRTVSRDFAADNDPNTIIERSRPLKRTDAQLAVNQTLIDFGATSERIAAAGARLRSAAAGLDDAAGQIALRTIGAWYDLFTYRTLIALGEEYRTTQEARRGQFAERIEQGASASADVARLDSSIASIQTRIARYRREAANAEARFAQLTGRPAPENLMRAPYLGTVPKSVEEARSGADDVPAVQATAEQAEAARQDAKAARHDTYPNISAGIDAGRYGVFEQGPDYDIRARVTLRKRLFGGIDARADQVRARANGAVARSARVREEAARDAAIAWSDVDALGRQTVALEQSYIAARQSRDTIEERFLASRGTLFDVLDANDAYFASAAAYVESLADRDAAHYVLLARTGKLLPALGIASAYDENKR